MLYCHSLINYKYEKKWFEQVIFQFQSDRYFFKCFASLSIRTYTTHTTGLELHGG